MVLKWPAQAKKRIPQPGWHPDASGFRASRKRRSDGEAQVRFVNAYSSVVPAETSSPGHYSDDPQLLAREPRFPQ